MNLKLNLNFKRLLPVISRFAPAIVGVALISLFGYTAYLINHALNLTPGTATVTPPPSISFDKPTITYIQSLKVVPDQTGINAVGTTNPFAGN